MEIREEGSGQDFNQDTQGPVNTTDKDATGRWLAPTPQALLWDCFSSSLGNAFHYDHIHVHIPGCMHVLGGPKRSLRVFHRWMMVESLSCVWFFATPWSVALQAPLSMGLSRQEYRSGLPFPSLWDLPDPGIEPRSPALQEDSLLTELCRKTK